MQTVCLEHANSFYSLKSWREPDEFCDLYDPYFFSLGGDNEAKRAIKVILGGRGLMCWAWLGELWEELDKHLNFKIKYQHCCVMKNYLP